MIQKFVTLWNVSKLTWPIGKSASDLNTACNLIYFYLLVINKCEFKCNIACLENCQKSFYTLFPMLAFIIFKIAYVTVLSEDISTEVLNFFIFNPVSIFVLLVLYCPLIWQYIWNKKIYQNLQVYIIYQV